MFCSFALEVSSLFRVLLKVLNTNEWQQHLEVVWISIKVPLIGFGSKFEGLVHNGMSLKPPEINNNREEIFHQ